MATALDSIVGPFDEQTRLKMLAQQLAGQQGAGLIGMVSGVPGMMDAGKAAYVGATDTGTQAVQNYETGLNRLRQAAADKSNAEKWQAQIDSNERIAQERWQSALDVANARADAAEEKSSKRPIPQAIQTSMSGAARALGTLDSLEKYSDAAEKGGINMGNPASVPFVRAALNTGASISSDLTSAVVGKFSKGAGEDIVPTADWWREYNNLYSLGASHELFGSAFTADEQRRWDSANIGPGASAKQRADALATMKQIAQTKFDQMRAVNSDTYGEERMGHYDPTQYNISIPSIDRRLGKETIATQTGGDSKLITRSPPQASSSPSARPQAPAAGAPGVPRFKISIGPDGKEVWTQVR